MKLDKKISLNLSDLEWRILIELLNQKFELDNFSDAIRYCIRKEGEKLDISTNRKEENRTDGFWLDEE